MKHMPRLDALRGLAVLAVLVYHFGPRLPISGALGVQLFMVLSGFLISSILLEMKARELPLGKCLKKFYMRRAFRIFPLFYVVFAIGCVLALPGFRKYWPYHLFYASNFPSVHSGGVGTVGHFWSLAVEEQFYLLWPLVLIVIPWKKLPAIMVGFGVVACAYRLWVESGQPLHFYYLLPASFDYFALGGLLALRPYISSVERWTRPLSDWRVLNGLIIVALCCGRAGVYSPCGYRFCLGLIFAGVIARCADGTGWRILDSCCLQYLGRISYGIYLYHLPVIGLISLHVPIDWTGSWSGFLWKTATTLCVAIPSYHFFEKPINDLKDKPIQFWSRRIEYSQATP